MGLKHKKHKKKGVKLADRFCSSFNRAKSRQISCKIIKKNNKIWKYLEREKHFIGNYIEIILSPCRHSLCLQRDGVPDKI